MMNGHILKHLREQLENQDLARAPKLERKSKTKREVLAARSRMRISEFLQTTLQNVQDTNQTLESY